MQLPHGGRNLDLDPNILSMFKSGLSIFNLPSLPPHLGIELGLGVGCGIELGIGVVTIIGDIIKFGIIIGNEMELELDAEF